MDGDRRFVAALAIAAFAFFGSSAYAGDNFLGVGADMAMEADGHVVIFDYDTSSVVRMNPEDGSCNLVRAVGFSNRPRGIAVEADGDLVMTDFISSDDDVSGRVTRMFPDGTGFVIVKDDDIGQGIDFFDIHGIAVEADGQLVVLNGFGSVVSVDPSTGDTAYISHDSFPVFGSGPDFGRVVRIAVESPSFFVVADVWLEGAMRVHRSTGDRTILSGAGNGAGPAFDAPVDIAVEASGQLVLPDRGLQAIVRVDPNTGDRTIVSDVSTGSGTTLIDPFSIAVGATGDIFVIDLGLRAVVRVDPITGDRIVMTLDCGPDPELFGAPIRAPAPHDILKNRYISIDPRGAGQNNPPSHHIRVES